MRTNRKDDIFMQRLTKHTQHLTYSARDFEIPLCHIPPLRSLYYIGLTQRLSVNSRKKWFVNPIKIGVTQRFRMEIIFAKTPAIFNGHHPP